MKSPIRLADRDNYLNEIEKEIIAKRQFILEKKKQIDKKKKENHFLNEVRNDYETFYQILVHEKKQQYQSLEILNAYLHDLSKTNQLANHELKNIKQEQQEIIEEMNKIKEELNKILKY